MFAKKIKYQVIAAIAVLGSFQIQASEEGAVAQLPSALQEYENQFNSTTDTQASSASENDAKVAASPNDNQNTPRVLQNYENTDSSSTPEPRRETRYEDTPRTQYEASSTQDENMIYLGIQFGRDFGYAKAKSSLTTTATIDNDLTVVSYTQKEHYLTNGSYLFRGNFGYNYVLDKKYLFGLEAFGTINSGENNSSQLDTKQTVNGVVRANITLIESNLKTQYSYGITFNPGVYLVDKLFGYFFVGWARGTFKTDMQANGSGSSKTSHDHTKNGITAGLGFKGAVMDRLNLGVRYGYSRYSSFGSTTNLYITNLQDPTDDPMSAVVKNSFSVRSNELSLSLDYLF